MVPAARTSKKRSAARRSFQRRLGAHRTARPARVSDVSVGACGRVGVWVWVWVWVWVCVCVCVGGVARLPSAGGQGGPGCVCGGGDLPCLRPAPPPPSATRSFRAAGLGWACSPRPHHLRMAISAAVNVLRTLSQSWMQGSRPGWRSARAAKGYAPLLSLCSSMTYS